MLLGYILEVYNYTLTALSGTGISWLSLGKSFSYYRFSFRFDTVDFVFYRELDKLQKESVSSWYLSHNQVLNFSFYLYNVQVVLFIPTTEVGQDKLTTWFKWRTPYSSVNVG